MGMFYIYTNKDSYELYNSITFSNPRYVYIEPDDLYDLNKIEVRCEINTIRNIWDNFLCVELLPKTIIIHYGTLFADSIKKEWDAANEWLYNNGYNKASNLYLKECFSCVEDAAEGVKYFCEAVATTKATQYLLMGYANSTNFSN